MAFPGVVNSAVTDGSSATSTPTINLPASLVADNLLVGFFRSAGNDSAPSGFTDWNIIHNQSVPNADDYVTIFWKRAAGDEGADFTISASDDRFTAIVYQIENSVAAFGPHLSSPANSTSDTPNPQSITPGGGAQDFLWIWLGSWVGKATSPPDNLPAGYSDILGASSGGAGPAAGNCRTATCTQQTNAATLGRESLTISSSLAWVAWQLAVFPAAGGTTHDGAADVDGSATVTDATAEVDHQAEADVTGTATVTLATATPTWGGFADVTGVATVTLATGELTKFGAADVTGVATIDTATGSIKKLAEAEAAGLAVASALARVDYSANAGVTGAATIRAWPSLNMILGVPFSPDGEASTTNVTGDWTDLVDDPYDIDANWVEAVIDGSNTLHISDYTDSLHAKVIKSPHNYHDITATVRKSASGTNPALTVGVMDNFAVRETPVDGQPVSNLTSEVFEGTFNLFDSVHPTLFRILLQGVVVDTATVEFGAVRVYLAMEGTRIRASVSGVATVTDATGGLRHIGAADVTGTATITLATGQVKKIAAADVTGVATVTLATGDRILGTTADVTGTATITDADPDLTLGASADVTGVATVTLATGDVGGIQDGAADVTGVATVTDATAEVDHQAAASVAGAATVTDATASPTWGGFGDVTGVATVTEATGGVGGEIPGEADVTGIATVSDATAAVEHQAAAAVTGVATITLATGELKKIGAADVTGIATATGTARADFSAAASVSGVATVDARAALNIIYGVPFAPDGQSANINMIGTWEDIDDDPYDIDGNWLLNDVPTSNSQFLADFPDSLQHKVVQSQDIHEVAVTVRKNASGGTDPKLSMFLWNNVQSLEQPMTLEDVSSDVSEVHTATFSLLPADSWDQLDKFRVNVFGSDSGDRNIDIAALRIYLAMEGTRIAASVTGVATVTLAEGSVGGVRQGEASVTGVATIAASATMELSANADVTGECTVTLADGAIVKSAAADVTGVASIDAVADLTLGTTASVTGVATVTLATGATGKLGSAFVTGVATVSAVAYVLHSADADVTGVATVSNALGRLFGKTALPTTVFFQPAIATKATLEPGATTVASFGEAVEMKAAVGF
jgi:hypothetical protein